MADGCEDAEAGPRPLLGTVLDGSSKQSGPGPRGKKAMLPELRRAIKANSARFLGSRADGLQGLSEMGV